MTSPSSGGWEHSTITTSSPVAATDKIYIASADKEVVVLDAGEELKVPAKNNSTVGS